MTIGKSMLMNAILAGVAFAFTGCASGAIAAFIIVTLFDVMRQA